MSLIAAARALRWATVRPDFFLAAAFFLVDFLAFGVAVAVGADSAALDFSPLFGRIICAETTPTPMNAAVANRPKIRRDQRETGPRSGSRRRSRSACTLRALLSIRAHRLRRRHPRQWV